MSYGHGGWRGWVPPPVLVPVSGFRLPVPGLVPSGFCSPRDPTSRTTYFFFQSSESLINRRFFIRLTLGLLVNDIGPITTVLMAVAVLGAAWRRDRVRPLMSWTVMGAFFIFLFAPKFLDHDYYGL